MAAETATAPTLLGATVADVVRRTQEEDARLIPGALVTVRWGYGSGFRASGKGRILKVNRLSVQVELLEDVQSPYDSEKVGWPKGYVLSGIARFASTRWDQYNSVIPCEESKGGV